jgi:hypothetical protein
MPTPPPPINSSNRPLEKPGTESDLFCLLNSRCGQLVPWSRFVLLLAHNLPILSQHSALCKGPNNKKLHNFIAETSSETATTRLSHLVDFRFLFFLLLWLFNLQGFYFEAGVVLLVLSIIIPFLNTTFFQIFLHAINCMLLRRVQYMSQ